MTEVSRMSGPVISPGSRSVISSQASAAGLSHLDLLDGPTTGLSGPEAVPANLSARQAKALGLLTSGTYGPPGTGSFDSADLTASMESRLQPLCSGGIWYRQTWKRKVTPAGRQLLAHTASAPRTSGSGSTGWPTARMTDGEKNVRTVEGSLKEIARKGSPQDLNQAACLAGWVSPTAMDGRRGSLPPRAHDTGVPLDQMAALAAWPTPTTRDHKDGASDGMAPINGLLGRTAWLTAEMGSGGQLNPEHSRYLMGYPAAWGYSGAMAMQSFLKPQRRSSRRAREA